ncbi:SGNH/GDSL hydrolase family protein [Nocardia crassostreae]|uniref:SGNH/GDSL hydrolase family protein n=1 Tax=Nocardia crassostreae TaxID=53428 RepID=UPI0012F9CD16|nr:SGNH/GDSL hydrolase family protein [Nocardia crassostreae]
MVVSRSRTASFAAVAALVVAVLAGYGAKAATAQPVSGGFHRYVALGDSAAAVGSLGLLEFDASPLCGRSSDNYPSDVARGLGVGEFVYVTCSFATTDAMWNPQTAPLMWMPPQFDALTPDTDLVTITIGFNDIGFDNPFPSTLAVAAAKIGAVLDGIHQRSPRATVVVSGYMPATPPTGPGCWGFPAGGGVALNAMLRSVAADHSALFADPGGVTGHDMCQPPGLQWVNPPYVSVPLHPNAIGQSYVASLIMDAVRG